MITKASPLIDYIKKCESYGGCQEALDWLNNVLKEKPDATCGEAVDLYLLDETIPEVWSVWNVTKFAKELDADMLSKFAEDITNPVMALKMYLDNSDVCKACESLLVSKFTGKLPAAEKALADGTLTQKDEVV